MRNIIFYLVFFLSLMSVTAYAETEPKAQFGLGISVGAVNGQVRVTNDTNNIYTDERGLGPTLGLFIERSITPIIAATANLELVNSWGPGLRETSSSSGYLASFGGVIGRVNQPRSAYLSFAYGLSFVDIDELGSSDGSTCVGVCFFGTTGYKRGGKGNGTGYRLAIGRTFKSRKARAEIAYSKFNGTGSDFPTNSQAEISAWQAVIRILVK